MSIVSDRLLEVIENSELTYEEIAKISGVPKSAINRYAKGGTDKIPIDRIVNVAKALNISPAYLMGWEDKKERSSEIDERMIYAITENKMLYDFFLSIMELSDEQQQKVVESCCFLVNQEKKYHY